MKVARHADHCVCFGCDPGAPHIPGLQWRRQVGGAWLPFAWQDLQETDMIVCTVIEPLNG